MSDKIKQNDIIYKKKAIKYKIKYLELKNKLGLTKLKGGLPEWYSRFNSDLLNIYQLVKNSYGTEEVNPILTGSGAIAYVLNYLGMNEDLDNLDQPRDLDFLYLSRTGLPNPNKLGNFTLNPRQKSETSVTFTIDSDFNSRSSTDYIKSFDVTKINNVKYFEINSINIINLESLSGFYTSDFFDDEEKIKKDERKKNLIKKIIEKIKNDNREEEFGMKSIKEEKKKSAGLFGDSENEESDDEFNIKKSSRLFGDSENEESDDEFNIKKSSRLSGGYKK
jgi:hypothetical protein